jgi:hypothetical protein
MHIKIHVRMYVWHELRLHQEIVSLQNYIIQSCKK